MSGIESISLSKLRLLCTYQWFAVGWGAGGGQPTRIRLRKAHVGGNFDIHNGPQGGKCDFKMGTQGWEN